MKQIALITILCLIGFYRASANEPEEISVHIAKYKADKICALSYTFDDGLKEHYTLASPGLERYGFRGTF